MDNKQSAGFSVFGLVLVFISKLWQLSDLHSAVGV